MTETDYGSVRGPDEFARHVDILAWSFAIPKEDLVEFFARVGQERIRVLREGSRPIAGLTLLPMAQRFGGRSVPMTGVNLVGTAPEARGRGAATRLMQACVREMRGAGVPISTLYPAKQTLYRRVGWEIAGGRWEISVTARDLDVTARDLDVQRVTPELMPAIHEIHRRTTIEHSGPIDRPDYMWRRIVDPLKRDVQGFAAVGGDGPESYAFLQVTRAEGMRQELQVTDLGASTPRGARALLRVLADHDTLADRIVWFGNPADAVLGQIAEFVWKTRLFFPWMVRILDPRLALEARGYPLGLESALHLEVTDATLPENAGRFVLEISEGSGRVRSGGKGTIRADIRGLAALYSGWTTPRAARALGLMDGPEDALQRAAAAFAGPIPWMADMF